MSGVRYVSILMRNDIDLNTMQLLNEEGLPIIEISEPMERPPQPASGASSGTGPTQNAEDTGFVPMHRLPPVERARNRAQMDRILDMLEEEERIESERQQARDREQRREELEQLRANAKAGPERVKAAKEMQKKMGKALLKNMADARERDEKEKARQEREDLEREEARRSRKPRKSVSWAELPKQERSSARSPTHDASGPDLPSRLPMRPHVVERFPARSGASSPPPPVPMGDSDDESDPPSPAPSDSDASGEIRTDGVPFPTPEHAQSDDGSEDEDEPVESHDESEDGFDIDAIQHQREIALAYFERRNTIGVDAARAMSAHSPDLDGGENEWDQEASRFPALYIPVTGLTKTPKQDVSIGAMLAGPRPKPSQSKFKSERLAQTYPDNTRLPPSTLPTSLATSAVLPNSTSGALRSAVRLGRLEGGQLVGNTDSDDGEEDEGNDTTNARTREFMDALYRGDVTNAGTAENTDALIAALETAYGAPPPKQLQHPHPSAQSPPTVVTASIPASAAPPKTAPPVVQKSSKFKLARAAPPPTVANNEGLREGGADRVQHRTGALSAKLPSSASVPVHIVGSPTVPDISASLPPMIVNSPSFAPPPPGGGGRGGDAPSPITTTIIDSPSFQKPQSPLASARPTRRPPTVLPCVRESSGTQRQQETTSTHEPGRKVSRFKAQRAEP